MAGLCNEYFSVLTFHAWFCKPSVCVRRMPWLNNVSAKHLTMLNYFLKAHAASKKL